MSFKIAIVGRANVGKSTLFNSIIRKKSAITYDEPGVTRDRKEEEADFFGMKFSLIDTAGFEMENTVLKAEDIINQINIAVEQSDLILFVIDAKSGLMPQDFEFIKYIRKESKPVILVINKSEVKKKVITELDIKKLGFKSNIYISATHNQGYQDLYASIEPFYAEYHKNYPDNAEEEDTKYIRIAIVGKPNVGKSTLINNLLKNDRLLTADESGTTRDSIEIKWQYKGRDIKLIDTAGIRKRAKISQKLEELSCEDSYKAIRFSDICIIIFDGSQKKLEKQDLSIISQIIDEGRGLIVVLNKADLLKSKEIEEVKDEIKYQINKYVPQNRDLEIITMSSKFSKNIYDALDEALKVNSNWNKKISTSKLNHFLNDITQNHRPPLYKGKEIKFKYITQTKIRPPTFMITTNHPERIPDSYIRYLKNELIKIFKLQGINPRFIFRKERNPYKGGKKVTSYSHKK